MTFQVLYLLVAYAGMFYVIIHIPVLAFSSLKIRIGD